MSPIGFWHYGFVLKEPECFSGGMVFQVMRVKSKNVLELLGPRIGSEVLMIRHNKISQDGRPSEKFLNSDLEINSTIYDSEYDGTELRVIRSA